MTPDSPLSASVSSQGRLAGKVALVTGAGSVGPGWGNGRAIAVRFAEEGARVYGVDRDPERLTETARLIADQRLSDEGLEGVAAFLEKRKPGWAL